MADKNGDSIPKISVRIFRPLIELLRKKIDNACLRRDAYLIKLLEVELDFLDREVSLPNSEASYKFVWDRLEQYDRKLVSLALPRELTERLDQICKSKRIVRDAFFNRLFLLLVCSPGTIDELFFPFIEDDWRDRVWREDRHEAEFSAYVFYPLDPLIDPFWALRRGLDKYETSGQFFNHVDPVSGKSIRAQRTLSGAIEPANSLYTVVFDQVGPKGDLLGLNCYMPDWRIPGHEANQKYQVEAEELLAGMGIKS